jgi:coenzyme F420-reducing hydrogenase gamma subunit
VNKDQLLEVLAGRKPNTPAHSVCLECKRRGTVCLMVASGTPCLGPVTHAGCGAICPSFSRGCYGCFGSKEAANAPSLAARWKELGAAPVQLSRAFRSFAAADPVFRTEAERHG